jgi:hypothetical protein
MKMLPEAEAMLIVRTDFSDQEKWEAVCAALGEPDEDGFIEEFMDQVEIIDDIAYRDLTPQQIVALVPDGYDDPIVTVADKMTIGSAEMPILVIDLVDERGRAMRVIPAELPSIQANLSIANMDFYEFADSVEADGIFRGFSH